MLNVPIDRIVPLTDARDNFSRIVADIEQQTDGMYVLTKGGKPAIALVNIEFLNKLMGGKDLTVAPAPKVAPPKLNVSTPPATPKIEPPVITPPSSAPTGLEPKRESASNINSSWTGSPSPWPLPPFNEVRATPSVVEGPPTAAPKPPAPVATPPPAPPRPVPPPPPPPPAPRPTPPPPATYQAPPSAGGLPPISQSVPVTINKPPVPPVVPPPPPAPPVNLPPPPANNTQIPFSEPPKTVLEPGEATSPQPAKPPMPSTAPMSQNQPTPAPAVQPLPGSTPPPPIDKPIQDLEI